MPTDTHRAKEIVWQPTTPEPARVSEFMRAHKLKDFAHLYAWSIDHVADFTEAVLRFLEIEFNPPYEKVMDTSNGIAWTQWCVGGGLNIAEACVDAHVKKGFGAQLAVVWEGEEATPREISYQELHTEATALACGLRQLGIAKGDCVGLHLPMMIETVVALIALGRIGAIAVPVFSGYGADAIAARLNDTSAKALISCDGFPRRGKVFNACHIADEAVKSSPSIKTVIVVNRADENHQPAADYAKSWRDVMQIGRSVMFQETQLHRGYENDAEKVLSRPEPTHAEDVLLLLYTSGTTGKPKGIVHTHCGFPIKAAQDMAFGCDVKPGTRISWITDIGWMMGAWLIYGALLNRATLVLYDGAPDYPAANRLWSVVEKHQVEVLGISPSLIRALATEGDNLPQQHDLSALRMFASTGEPWDDAAWQWLFEKVGQSKLPIINYSGGTEISGGILMNSPVLGVKPCAFAAPCPGIQADVVDEHGDTVSNQVGELVIRQPWIGMARGFWKEPARYLETYWSRFENLWVHGDFAERDADGHYYIHGRSDDTLKIAGKRVGPAEVETILTAHELVTEAAVIGIPDANKGTAMIALCVLAKASDNAFGGNTNDNVVAKNANDNAVRENLNDNAVEKNANLMRSNMVESNVDVNPELRIESRTERQSLESLQSTLREKVAASLGKPLRPEKVLFVEALPKTRNAKTMRRLIRAAYLGEPTGDISALENPQALDAIRQAAQTSKLGNVRNE